MQIFMTFFSVFLYFSDFTPHIYTLLVPFHYVFEYIILCIGYNIRVAIYRHQDTPEHESEVLWLSILGEVYDVTPGRQYYGKGASYSIMAGRDASPSFVTGEFTEEGAAKSLSEIDPKEIAAINEWKKFYVESDKYSKVGVLEGLYYDSEGKETPSLIEAMGKVEEGERLAKIERERRAQIRKDKLAKRKKEREAKEKLKQKKK